MNSASAKLLDKIDKDLTALLERLKDYSHQTLNRKPGGDKWSVMQVVHHLMMAESLSHQYVQKKVNALSSVSESGVLSGIRKYLLKFFLKTPFRYKAPPIVGDSTLPEEASFWESAKRWKQNRSELREFLSQLPDEAFGKSIYRHPIAGRMSIHGMLLFFDAHFKRHQNQIENLLKDY